MFKTSSGNVEQLSDEGHLFRFAAWFSSILAVGLGVAMELL